MSQVKIDFLVTGNMSSLHKQVQTLNAELMAVAGTMTAVDRSMSNIDLQAANAQFGRMMTTSGQFTQQMVTMRTSTDLFSEAISRQNVTMRQAFSEARRYVTGRGGLIRDLAKQQVMMQNSVVMPHGVSPTGKVTASVLTPTGLDKDFNTQMRVANKSWEVFNATAQQGATQMVNWGKNTQWAGRQLMVGFTVPLMMAGGLAAKTFKDLDEELVRLQKVYGSGFSFGEDFQKQSEMIRASAIQMAKDMAQAYGQAGTETAALMADLAATGFEGQDLMKMTEQTTKLATLGEVDRQEAMKATVALQSAFKMSTDEVADSVLFLNAVENQTSASLQDLVEAIPRAGTVVEGLGGSVEDLALYMVAMREGGISAAEGANALKSGLSSIIAPPKAATEFMKEFGINLPKIVQENAGQLTPTLMAFQEQLKGLDDLARQQVITKLFGKYQFARMNAFFNNLGASGSQTQKVLDLMGTSLEDLGQLADQEVAAKAESVSGKWDRAWESFKINIAVIGEDLLKLGTMVLNVFNKVFGFIADNPWLMNIVKYLGLAAAAIGPVIMLMGLFGNMIGMIGKGALRLVNIFKVMGSGGGIKKTFEVMTAESFQADTAVEQLTGSMYEQKTAQEVLTQAVREYTLALEMLQGQARSTSTAVSAMNITDPLMADKYTRLMGAQPRAKTKGILLGTEANNQGRNRAGIANYTPAELSKMSPQQLARMGLVMRMIETGGVTVPGVSGNSTTAASSALSAAKGGAPEAWNDMVVRAVNDPSVQRAYAQEFASAEQNPAKYAAGLVAREVKLQTERSMQSGNLGPRLMALNAVAASAVMPGQSAPANLDATKFKALTSNDTLSILAAAGDKLAAELEHLVGKTQTVEDAMTMIASMEKEYGLNLEDLKASVLKRANASDKIGLTEEELASVLARFNQNVNEANAWMEKVTTEISEFVGNINGLNANGVDRLEKALMQAAMETEGVTFTEVTAAGKRYAVALDQAGNVIRESSFLITDAGGTASLAAKSNAKHLDDLNAALADTTGTMQVEEHQRRSLTDAIVVDETATRTHTGATEVDTVANMTEAGASDASAAADLRETSASDAAASADAREAGMSGVAGAPATGGMMNYLKNNKSMIAGGTLMGGAMMGSMLLPEGPASNVANMTMMGAGVGGMFGPWGLAVGGVAGLITGGLTEAFKASSERAKEEAEIAAASWEAEFSNIEIDQSVADALGIKNFRADNTTSFAMPDVGVIKETADLATLVKEQLSAEIEDMAKAEDVVVMAKRLLAQLIEGGATVEEANAIVAEALKQSGNTDYIKSVLDESITTQKEARDYLNQDEKNRRAAAFAMKPSVGSLGGNVSGPIYGGSKGSPPPMATLGELVASEADAKKAGDTVAQVFSDAFKRRWEKGLFENPAEVQKYYTEQLNEIVSGAAGDLDFSDLQENAEQLANVGIEIEGKSPAEVLQEIINLGPEAKATLSESGPDGLGGDLYNSFLVADRGATGLAATLQSELGPEFDAAVADAETLEGKILAVKNALFSAQMEANRIEFGSVFSGLADKFIPEMPEPINLEQLERAQAREMELMQEHEQEKLDALQEAEDARLEAMQEAAEKRENAIQKEINQTERQYDQEIAAIQRAEAKRQEAFQNEQDRFARRQELRNLELSYQEAIANGELFTAARIRMDINATKKQQDAQTKEEKRQENAEDKIKKLEKEKNQKIRILNKELRVEQRKNEKAIESAQEASEAKIEAAQKASEAAIAAAERANRLELKAAKETNREIAQDRRDLNATIAKMRDALLEGDKRAFDKYAKELNLSARDTGKWISETLEKTFGPIPEKLRRAIMDNINNKEWNDVGTLVQAAILGTKPPEQKPPGGDGSHGVAANYATGGFVTGPGTPTSDSINARLSNGEYVVRQREVARHGKSKLDALNSGRAQIVEGFAKGGIYKGAVRGVGGAAKMALRKKISVAAPEGSIDTFGAQKGLASGDIVYWDGEPIDQLIAKQLKIAGKIAGNRFTVYQGSYQPQTSYSGTTHTDGGVVDTSGNGVFSPEVVALQKAGFAAWYRGPGAPGAAANYPAHIHAVSLFSKNLDTNAAFQRDRYLAMSGDGISGPYYGPHAAPIAGLKKMLGLRKGGRINYDNTLANLHKGETVLTKSLSDKFEDRLANLGGNEYNFDVTIENLSSEVDLERAFEKFVVKHERRQQARNGRSRRI